MLLVVLIVAGASTGGSTVLNSAQLSLFCRDNAVNDPIQIGYLCVQVSDAGGRSPITCNKGFRIILVLPENEDEKTVLLSKLSKVIHSGTLFYTRTALGPYSGDLLHALGQKHRNGEGYLLLCEQQLPARTAKHCRKRSTREVYCS